MSKIPKVIHYCWFGGKPMPRLQKNCLKTWQKLCPEYEIKLWNEDNFDFQVSNYAREAYEAGKYAFVSDYARFQILYENGGVFLDTDVELVRPLRELEQNGCFMACEAPGLVNTGLALGAPAGDPMIKLLLDGYSTRHFLREDSNDDLTTVVDYVTEYLKPLGLREVDGIQQLPGVTVYPPRYFCPKNMQTGRVELTKDTFSIHRFAASWETPVNRFRGNVYRALRRCFGKKLAERIRDVAGRNRANTQS